MNDLWDWIKDHPYISAGVGVGTVVLIWLLWPSSSNSGSNLTFSQQQQQQRLIGNQQLAALRIQQQPQLAGLRSQNYQAGWQGRVALAGLGEQTTLANIQAAEAAQLNNQQNQSNNYLAFLSAWIASIMNRQTTSNPPPPPEQQQ